MIRRLNGQLDTLSEWLPQQQLYTVVAEALTRLLLVYTDRLLGEKRLAQVRSMAVDRL